MNYWLNKPSTFLWKSPNDHPLKEKLRAQKRRAYTFYTLSDDDCLKLYQERLVDSELCYGTEVEFLNETDTYFQVAVPSQRNHAFKNGYEGWVFKEDIDVYPGEILEGEQKIVVSQQEAEILVESSPQAIKVSLGTILPFIQEEADFFYVQTPNGRGKVAKEVAQFYNKNQKEAKKRLIELAKSYLDLRYVWSGVTHAGFDCSGFIYTLFKTFGCVLSRDADDQSLEGQEVTYSEAQPGDVLYFAYDEGKGVVHHVGLYLGEDQMIHSHTPGSRVMISTISGTKYESELCTVRRHLL